MDNENKRFKQINRIATPIQVTKENNVIEEPVKTQEEKEIKPIKAKKHEKKQISKIQIVEALIGLFVIGIIVSASYLLILTKNKSNTLKYNDAKTSQVGDGRSFFFGSETLSESLYLAENIDYAIENFTIKQIGNTLYVNNIAIATKENFSSTVGLIDDLMLITGSDSSTRTTTLYVISSTGEKVLEMYNIGDISGMVLKDDASVFYGSESVTLSASNVINDQIILNNNTSNRVTICDEEELFKNSIENSRPVNINYAFLYEGNHSFKLEATNIESLEEYKKNNNYCN